MLWVSTKTALTALQQGQMLIVVDDDGRENEGDLVVAADFATPAVINFMAQFGRGLICIAMTAERLDALQIPLMPTSQKGDVYGTAFTVSVEARQGVTTGISAYDRAHTIHTLIHPGTTPQDIVYPGHMFPLRARPGGVLERPGHTEAGVDLAQLAGLTPAVVICEIMAEDGTMARRPELERFAQRHRLPLFTIAELISYQQQQRLQERTTKWDRHLQDITLAQV